MINFTAGGGSEFIMKRKYPVIDMVRTDQNIKRIMRNPHSFRQGDNGV